MVAVPSVVTMLLRVVVLLLVVLGIHCCLMLRRCGNRGGGSGGRVQVWHRRLQVVIHRVQVVVKGLWGNPRQQMCEGATTEDRGDAATHCLKFACVCHSCRNIGPRVKRTSHVQMLATCVALRRLLNHR